MLAQYLPALVIFPGASLKADQCVGFPPSTRIDPDTGKPLTTDDLINIDKDKRGKLVRTNRGIQQNQPVNMSAWSTESKGTLSHKEKAGEWWRMEDYLDDRVRKDAAGF